ncbi:MAG: UDP binding domain-containing protein, partial [Geminicoccaceae bacterium]
YAPVAGGTGGAVQRGKDQVTVVDSLDEAVTDADTAILVTRWEDFRTLPELLSRRSPPPLLVDGRRMLERDAYTPYAGVGLGPAK